VTLRPAGANAKTEVHRGAAVAHGVRSYKSSSAASFFCGSALCARRWPSGRPVRVGKPKYTAAPRSRTGCAPTRWW